MALISEDQATQGTASELNRRLALGWAESISIRGYRRTTVRDVIASSGVSRRTFYERFGGKTEAFVAIHAEALDRLADRVGAAAAVEPDWPGKVAAGIATGLREMAEEPCRAQLLLGDPLGAGPRMGYCQERLVARFAPTLAEGRRFGPASPPPQSLETALLGSLIEIVSSRLRSGSAQSLPDLAPQLTEFVLSPYLGSKEAKRIARLATRDFAAAFEGAFADLRARIDEACATRDEWPAQVAVGVRAAFAFAASHPDAARLLTCEALARGEQGQLHYRGMISYFATLLLPGRDLCPGDGAPAAIAESAAVAGLTLLVGRRLELGREDELPTAAAGAAEFVLTPYVGIDEARRIASEHCP